MFHCFVIYACLGRNWNLVVPKKVITGFLFTGLKQGALEEEVSERKYDQSTLCTYLYEDILLTPLLHSIYPLKVKHGTGEVVLLVKCLPLKPKDLSSILSIHVMVRVGGRDHRISGSC